MPKSKSNKIVHLTQVKKKGKDHKEDLLKQLEQYGEKFARVYLFDFEQTKSDRIMLLRTRLKEHGRIFSGKNSLVSLALRNLGSRSNTNYDKLIKQVSGHRGLLFTDLPVDKLTDLLSDELPEFRQKLVGCAEIRRPANASSDDDRVESSAGDSDEEEDEDKDEAIEPSEDTVLKRRGKPQKSATSRKGPKSKESAKAEQKKKAMKPRKVKFHHI